MDCCPYLDAAGRVHQYVLALDNPPAVEQCLVVQQFVVNQQFVSIEQLVSNS